MRLPRQIVRLIAYLWALPTTLCGLPLLAGALLGGGGVALVDGVLEIHGGLATFYLRRVVGMVLKGGASAMTLGHIVVGRDRQALESTRAHERVHVRQCEWFGPFFIPCYLAASAYQWMRGRNAYRDNPFEKQAYDRVPHNHP